MNEPFQHYIDTVDCYQSDNYLSGLPKVAKILTLMADNQAVVMNYPSRRVETRLISGLKHGNGLYSLDLFTTASNELLAKCGFDYHLRDNSITLNHTPQGRHMNLVTREAQRIYNKVRDFRELILQDTIMLACSLGISKINAIGSKNHFKVEEGIISQERGVAIIDSPLIATGFTEDQDGNFCYNIEV